MDNIARTIKQSMEKWLRGEPGRKKQLEEKFGDWLESLSVNTNVPEEFTTNGPNIPFSEPSQFAIT